MRRRILLIMLTVILCAWVNQTQAVSVTFQVNMSIQQAGGGFNPATDQVKLAGNFNNWSTAANILTDANSDLIYEVTVDTFDAGEALQFKFIKTSGGTDTWESLDNRAYTVPASNATFTAYFNNVESLQSPVTVTFSANMELEIVSGRFNPATDTMTVRGSFNGWSGTDIMTPSVVDPNFYEFTKEYNVAPDEVWNYKFAYITGNGTTWENDPNKTYTFTSDDISAGQAVIERGFNNLSLENVTNNDVTIKFTVDVSSAVSSVTGQPFPAIENVVVAGANPPLAWPDGGWPDKDITKVHMLYDDGTHGDLTAGDKIWSADLVFSKYSPLRIQYKYGANWGLASNTGSNDNESSVGTDHFITMTPTMKSATVANVWSVMGDHDLINVSSGPVGVTFQVNMSIQQAGGNFNPATDQVKLAGNFNNWSTTANILTDANSDLIYETTIDTFQAGQALQFKFIKTSGGTDSWESLDNRAYTVPSGNSTFTAYFNNVEHNASPVMVTFSANMELEIVSGRFNPATDTMTVRGSFNGWSGTDIMSPSVSDPNFYEFTKEYNVAPGEVWNYKFAYITGSGTTWENDPNKTYTFTNDDISAGQAVLERGFNNLSLDNVTNYDVTIKFVVDVSSAVSSVTGQPFASIESVVIAGANPPLAWPDGGWPDADVTKVKMLYNDGTHGDMVAGDNLWSVDLVFTKYSPLRIQYKYGANWGLASNTGSNDNESSVGTDHFINLQPKMTSGEVHNVWSVMGDVDLVNVTDVAQQTGKVTTYSLDQNYPNPFNPSTMISFGIPEAGFVTIKVYNLLGQEVATLLNEEKMSGKYNVSFDASRLTSGTYFYTINSNKYTATKKMLLLK